MQKLWDNALVGAVENVRKGGTEDTGQRDIEERLSRRSKENIYKMTEEQYNRFGWTTQNGILSAQEVNEIEHRNRKEFKGKNPGVRTKDGYWALPIGASHGIDNVVVVTDMKFGSPKIERVYRIDSGNENYNEKVRDEIYEIEGTYDGKSIKYAKEVCESESFVAYSREDYLDLFEDRRYVAGEGRRGREVDRAAERLQDGSGSKEAAGENGAVKQSPRRKTQLTNREILASAFEDVAQTAGEREFLEKYKAQIDSLNEKEETLKRVQEAIRYKINSDQVRDEKYRTDLNRLRSEAKWWTRICTVGGQSIYNGSRRSKLIICSLRQKK